MDMWGTARLELKPPSVVNGGWKSEQGHQLTDVVCLNITKTIGLCVLISYLKNAILMDDINMNNILCSLRNLIFLLFFLLRETSRFF